MDLRLKGKRVAISGASKGIGLAIAEAFAQEGAQLVLAARSAIRLAEVAQSLRARFDVAVLECAVDLSLTDEQRHFVDLMGQVDVLINCAGSNPSGDIEQISEQTWRSSWDLKVFGYINLTRHVYSQMKARGEGVIVNIIGNSAQKMNDRYILGSTGNLALVGLTQALGARSPDFGVRVVGVHPGATATERVDSLLKGWSMSRFSTSDRGSDILAEMDLPFGRMCEPREIADTVVFLASSRSAYTSGTVVTVDGGATHRGK